MKKIFIASAIVLMASSAFANDQDEQFSLEVFGQSIVQTVAYSVADILGLSSAELSDATSDSNRKEVAHRIQNEVQDYGQTGLVSPFLADKIKVAQSFNATLSEAESVDALSIASDLILSK